MPFKLIDILLGALLGLLVQVAIVYSITGGDFSSSPHPLLMLFLVMLGFANCNIGMGVAYYARQKLKNRKPTSK